MEIQAIECEKCGKLLGCLSEEGTLMLCDLILCEKCYKEIIGGE